MLETDQNGAASDRHIKLTFDRAHAKEKTVHSDRSVKKAVGDEVLVVSLTAPQIGAVSSQGN